MKKRVHLVALPGLICCILTFSVYLWVSPRNRLKEEQKIYSMLIDEDVLLMEKTSLESGDWSSYIKNGLPKIEQETLIDFQDKNRETYSLKDHLPKNLSVTFMTQTELQEIAGDDSGRIFHERYPNASGYIWVSRIGFNSSFTQALVIKSGAYTFTSNSGLFYHWSGGGSYILLKKAGSRWRVIGELAAWVS
jgi:hypothetical protein